MRRVLSAMAAELFNFQLFRMQLFILGGGIISIFAFRAFQCNDLSHNTFSAAVG